MNQAAKASTTPTRAGATVIFDDEMWSGGFTQFPNAVIRAPYIEPDTKMLLLTILSYCWKDNSAFPSLETLARDLHRSERWVWGALRELIARDIMWIESAGVGKHNIYHITKCDKWNLGEGVGVTKDPRNRLHMLPSANACERQAPANGGSHTPANDARTRLRGNKTQVTKTHTEEDSVCGADAPAPPEPVIEEPKKTRASKPVRLTAISTDDSVDASPARRLSLKLARLVFAVKTSSPAVLTRYDGYFSGVMERGATVDECRRFLDWLASNGYWAERSYQFTPAQFDAEWTAWEGQGKPATKVKATASARGRKPVYQGTGASGDGRRDWKPCCPLCGVDVGMPHNTKDPLKVGVHCAARIVTDEDVAGGGRKDGVA